MSALRMLFQTCAVLLFLQPAIARWSFNSQDDDDHGHEHQHEHHHNNNTYVFLPNSNGSYTSQEYTEKCGVYKYFFYEMLDPCKDLNIYITVNEQEHVTGHPELYMSWCDFDDVKCENFSPTSEKLTWAAYHDGNSSLTISHWDPESSPGWYVRCIKHLSEMLSLSQLQPGLYRKLSTGST